MAAVAERVFQESTGSRGPTQLLLGVAGPSGAGKTESSLRLATGMQRVFGGEIYVLDSENNRARHYDDKYKFHHVPFPAPFAPSDYQTGIEFCRKRGAKIVIADSASHLHDGKGGILEWHAREVERIMAAWRCAEEKANIPAWNRPKTALREFIDYFTQIDVHLIFCFKAREKLKIGGGKVTQLGFMPIASDELVFELTAKVLLLPGADGVPTLQSNEVGEKMMIKLPGYLRPIFTGAANKPLDENVGQQLAQWAARAAPTARPAASQSNTPAALDTPTIADYEKCATRDAFDALETRRQDHWNSLAKGPKKELKDASDRASQRLASTTTGRPCTTDSAIAALRACQDDQSRTTVWNEIQSEYEASGRDISNELDACNQEVKERLQQL